MGTSNTNASNLGPKLKKLSQCSFFIVLPIIYFWFGGMKFTGYEAKGLVPLVEPSVLIGWMYNIFSEQGFSNFLGVLEIAIGLLILGRFLSPKLSAVGGVLSCGLFFTTLSFMLTTEGVFESTLSFPAISVMPGQFLLKDIGLLAMSAYIVGESLCAIQCKKYVEVEQT